MTASQMILHSAAVLLDFDGVVVDSEQQQSIVWEAVLRKHNIHTSEPIVVIGRMDEEIALSLVKSEKEASRLVVSKKEEFRKLFGDAPPPLVEGVREFVLNYQRIGLLGITSNSSFERVTAICNHYKLTEFFSVIVAARGSYEPKPSPQVYRVALESLKLSPQLATAIEDSPSGIFAAKHAGIRVVGIPTSLPRADLLEIADAVTDSFWQVMEEWRDIIVR